MTAIINYGAGNITSVVNALRRLGRECIITDDPADLARARGVIMPGQGRAGAALRALGKRGTLEAVRELKVPFLGICLGMQVLAERLAEDAAVGLGILPGEVFRLNGGRVPHIGWNRVRLEGQDELFEGIGPEEYFYFAHSYCLELPAEFVRARSWYGQPFPSVVRRDNFRAVQFHPEKSGPAGMQLLRNFCALCS